MRCLREKYHDDSDGYIAYACKTCGNTEVIYNKHM